LKAVALAGKTSATSRTGRSKSVVNTRSSC